MRDYQTLSRRLARLEQKHGADRQMGMLASWLDDAFGRLVLEAQPAERRQALLQADGLSAEDWQRAMQYPPLQDLIKADLAAWRLQRGLPPPDSEAHL